MRLVKALDSRKEQAVTFRVTVVLFATLIVACSEKPATGAFVDFDKNTTATVEQHIKELRDQTLVTQALVNQLREGKASVDTSQEIYGVARNQFGSFPIVAKSVTPHLDGYKIRLEIGNLTLATFHGAVLKIEWGQPFTKGMTPDQIKAYLNDRKNKEFSVTTVFAPGAYTGVDVVLTPATANDVREIDVAITLDRLALRRR